MQKIEVGDHFMEVGPCESNTRHSIHKVVNANTDSIFVWCNTTSVIGDKYKRLSTLINNPDPVYRWQKLTPAEVAAFKLAGIIPEVREDETPR